MVEKLGEGCTAYGNNATTKVIACPNEYFYFDYAQDQNSVKKILAFDPYADDRLSPEQKEYIWGVQANLWAEWVPTMKRVEYFDCSPYDGIERNSLGRAGSQTGLEELLSACSAIQTYGCDGSKLPYPRFAGIL